MIRQRNDYQTVFMLLHCYTHYMLAKIDKRAVQYGKQHGLMYRKPGVQSGLG